MVSVVPELTSTVWPSGALRATASAPTTVAPPGRFSTGTGWPNKGRHALGEEPGHDVG
jgi:hypothetical protein